MDTYEPSVSPTHYRDTLTLYYTVPLSALIIFTVGISISMAIVTYEYLSRLFKLIDSNLG